MVIFKVSMLNFWGFSGLESETLRFGGWFFLYRLPFTPKMNKSHRIHVWIIYLHEWLKFMVNVGKYTSPMDPMGMLRP